MSHFYGTLQGSKGQATRCGGKTAGMETYCASWKGAIRCFAYVKYMPDGSTEDWVRVEKTTWQGIGEHKLIYEGKIGTTEEVLK